MKNKVMTRLEPKARPYGFSKEELMTVCESIANGFSSEEEATEEAIDARIDAYLPILKLSQSAAHRAYERMKAKFEEENKPKPTPPTPPQEPKPQDPPKPSEEEMPSWFKSFQEKYESDRKATEDKFDAMTKAKANEGFMAKAKAGLKDVDPKFYSRDLNGRTFNTDDEVDTYVSGVVEDWTAFCSERNIKAMADVHPPVGNEKPTKPNDGVLARAEARKAEETKSAIKGLD